MTADEIIKSLGMQPHPEGGHYAETWIGEGSPRASGTAIYYLLAEGQNSHWHRIDVDELWHYYAGAPLELRISATDEGPAHAHILSGNLTLGRPQINVPGMHWQSARPLGDWTLVGCTVTPGFLFDRFEMAPPDFAIPTAPA